MGPVGISLLVVKMATDGPVTYSFPLDCPDCKAASGFPYKAGTKFGAPSAVLLAMRCRSCKHEWPLELSISQITPPTGGGSSEGPRRP
jgi:hypothetical protein